MPLLTLLLAVMLCDVEPRFSVYVLPLFMPGVLTMMVPFV